MSSTKTIDRLEVNKSIIFPDRTTLSSTNPFQLGQLAEFVTAWNDDLGVEWLECRVFDPNRKSHELFFAIWEDDKYEYQWDFTTSAASIVGTPVKTFENAVVSGGVLKVATGQAPYVTGVPTGTFTFCVNVIPKMDLSANRPDNENEKYLVWYGNIIVHAINGGYLTVYDGTSNGLPFTTTTTVATDPFHLAITNQGRTLKVYKDGTLIFTSNNSDVGGPNSQLMLDRGGEYSADVYGLGIWYDKVLIKSGVAMTREEILELV
eukprot:jgi/Mesvir1/8753/Mv02672-RA.1